MNEETDIHSHSQFIPQGRLHVSVKEVGMDGQ